MVGIGDNEYFVIASFTVAYPRASWKGFLSWKRLNFPRVIRDQTEVKFSNSAIDDELRIRTLEAIVGFNVRIRYVYLNKKNIPDKFRYKLSLREGHLYAHIVAELLEMYLPITDGELRAYCDERHLKGLGRREFQNTLQAHLIPFLSPGGLVQVDMAASHDNPNIQIADWIAGALSRHHNGRHLGERSYNTLRNSILGEGKELFKDTWIRD